jgi:hypothetical protein
MKFKKLIATVMLSVILTACAGNVIETPPEYTDTPQITTTSPDNTTAPRTSRTRTTTETTEPPATTQEVTTIPATTAAAVSPAPAATTARRSGYAPMVASRGSYGWTPGVLQKHVPEGFPDLVANAQALIDYNNMTFFIGVADLMNPDGYRHIDNSGQIHPSSVIKMWIMEYAYLQIYAGNGNLSDIISGNSLRWHIQEMIQLSCNTSTAHVISYFGRANIDNWIQRNYPNTRLHSDLRGNYFEGRTNTTTVADTIAFLENLYNKRNEEPYTTMLNLMVNTRTRAKFPAALSHRPEVTVANKTGSFIFFDAADHDVAIIIGRDENDRVQLVYAFVLYTFSRPYEPTFSYGRATFFDVTRSIYRGWRQHIEWTRQQALTTTVTTTTQPPTTQPETTIEITTDYPDTADYPDTTATEIQTMSEPPAATEDEPPESVPEPGSNIE